MLVRYIRRGLRPADKSSMESVSPTPQSPPVPPAVLSLKVKLTLALVLLPLVAVTIYLFVATNLFQQDKIAYVFDGTLSVARSLASETRSELQSLDSTLRAVVKNPAEFSAHSRLYDIVGRAGRLTKPLPATVGPDAQKPFAEESFSRTLKLLETQAAVLEVKPGMSPHSAWVLMGVRTRESADSGVVGIFHVPDFLPQFSAGGVYQNLLIDESGAALLGGRESLKSLAEWDFFKTLRFQKLPQQTLEAKSPDGESLLVSVYRVPLPAVEGVEPLRLSVVSMVSKDAALRAVHVLLVKSLLFLFLLVFVAVAVSVVAANTITRNLRMLRDATRVIAAGDFKVRVKVDTMDEVGELAAGFNAMTSEIDRLMQEVTHKARMEQELETARTVQERLFPSPDFLWPGGEIAGHYEPASECSGDLWHYTDLPDRILVWIGDATGHGVPAALITAAAKSVASVIEKMPTMGAAEAMSHLNHAIYGTSNGNMNMTFFIGCFMKETGLFYYCNASHDPPYLIRKKNGPLTKKDLKPLNASTFPRLGESPSTVYAASCVELAPGDVIFCYTDGIVDVQNPELARWGRKNFQAKLLEVGTTGGSAREFVNRLVAGANSYRQNAELLDDITVLAFQFHKAMAKTKKAA